MGCKEKNFTPCVLKAVRKRRFCTKGMVIDMADIEKNMALCALYDKYAPLLSEKKRRAFELYYWDDYSLSEVAYHTKTTRQAVRDLINHTSDELCRFEDVLHLSERSEKISEALDMCADELKRMKNTADSSAKEGNCDISSHISVLSDLIESIRALSDDRTRGDRAE